MISKPTWIKLAELQMNLSTFIMRQWIKEEGYRVWSTQQALTRLYLDKATLIWNGNAVSGHEELNKFFEMLPSSEFQVNVLDCQPVHEQATQGQTTVLVVTSGTVKFDGDKQRYFNQNFLLTAQATPTNTVWKIASDCFRFQDWAS
uniref:NTF2-related export protein n=2 Tax=Amazona collaria TaxID=241587 RepID=A0A8B9GDK4_9PSIT